MLQFIRFYLALIAWALWFGGFGLYFGVVVPTGGKVIGDSEQGFVTQQVTNWLNLIGLTSLPLLLWQGVGSRNRLSLVFWALLAILQIGLFAMHRQLDLLIDAPSRLVLNEGRFSAWHEWYEFVAAIQWFAGMAFLAVITRSLVSQSAK